MSKSVDTCPTIRAEEEEEEVVHQHHQHQQKQVLLMKDSETLVVENNSNDDDDDDASCSSSTVVASAKIPLRKKRNSDFALASYNSAFLEGLFEDIAATTTNTTCSNRNKSSSDLSLVVDQQGLGGPGRDDDDSDDEKAATTTTASSTTLSHALPSDHNIAKRRCVSTNKSLGRCGRSLANLSNLASVRNNARVVRKKSSVLMSSSPKSFADLSFLRSTITTAAAVRKKSSVLISSSSPLKFAASAAALPTTTTTTTTTTPTIDDDQKNHKELPATVSASFYLDLGLGQQQQQHEQAHTTGKVNTEKKNHQGDFGWFIDTDPTSHHEEGDGFHSAIQNKVHLSSNAAAAAVPLAFSAPTAPVGLSQDQKAEVEWAQAADTVDEVLGDLF